MQFKRLLFLRFYFWLLLLNLSIVHDVKRVIHFENGYKEYHLLDRW